MPTIGLTGNFGMGKSSVLKIFRELGAYTFSADTFVHQILQHPDIINKISKALGDEVIVIGSRGTSINKIRVADIVFSDPEKRKSLEGIIHPEVIRKVKKKAREILQRDPSALVVFEVPLLFEGGYEDHFDNSVVVYCNVSTAMKRVALKGFSREDARKRTAAQMSISKKKKLADYLIDNNGAIEKTKIRVRKIYNDIMTG